jgi:hypothetical protein
MTPSASLVLGDITNHITPPQQWTTGVTAIQDDPFCETAGEFKANRKYDLANKHYARSEQQGLVVSRDSLRRACEYDNTLSIPRLVTCLATPAQKGEHLWRSSIHVWQ